MSAISSFASLMLISTLGKDRGDGDDIYGNMISDALKEDDDEANEPKGKRRSEKKHVRPSIFRQLSSLQEESIANGHVTVNKTPSTMSNGHTSGELYSVCNGHFSADKDSPENLDLEPNHNGISSIGSTSRTSPCCESKVVRSLMIRMSDAILRPTYWHHDISHQLHLRELKTCQKRSI